MKELIGKHFRKISFSAPEKRKNIQRVVFLRDFKEVLVLMLRGLRPHGMKIESSKPMLYKNEYFNPFLVSVAILYPLNKPENLWFFYVFRGYEIIFTRNGLIISSCNRFLLQESVCSNVVHILLSIFISNLILFCSWL